MSIFFITSIASMARFVPSLLPTAKSTMASAARDVSEPW